MTSGAETPQKIPPRRIRQPKATIIQPATDGPAPQEMIIQGTTPIRLEGRRRPIERNQSNGISVPDQEPQTTTLSPPQSLDQHVKKSTLSLSDSPAVNGRNTRSKKSPNKQQGNDKAIATTSASRKNRSSRPDQRSSSMTPVKQTNVASQAYAGPTFHASPAPSALPIPKFFSKSMPANENATSLKSMMQDDSSEGSSNRSEESPTMKSSLRVAAQPLREASPLDLFFNADREEKAKRSSLFRNGSSTQISEQAGYPPKSVSPFPDHIRHHTRSVTGGSMNGMFPLEMDPSEKSSPPKIMKSMYLSSGAQRSDSLSSVNTIHTAQSKEQARAKTQALKNLLLLSPQPQASRPSTGIPTASAPYTDSPSSSPLPYHNHYLRSNSASSTPRTNAKGPGNFDRTLSPDHNLSNAKKSPAVVTRGPTQPRPLSSHLRQEVSVHTGPESNEVLSTPTPSPAVNVHDPTIARNSNSIQFNGNISKFTPAVNKFQPEDALKAATGQDNTSFDTIENALRKVLKLDHFDSDGATGVGS